MRFEAVGQFWEVSRVLLCICLFFLSGFSMLLCVYLGVLDVAMWLLVCSGWFLGYCYPFALVF